MRVVLTLLLMLACAASRAEWVRAQRNDVNGAVLYLDSQQIVRDGDNVKFWTLVDYPDQPYMGVFRSVKELNEIQCRGQMARTLEIIFFDDAMGAGKRRGAPFKDAEWKNVEPGTVQGVKWRIACEGK